MTSYKNWKVGDLAIRKERLCRILKIHFDEFPPHVTVQMLDDNNEIGTEFSKLKHATPGEIQSMKYQGSMELVESRSFENANANTKTNIQANTNTHIDEKEKTSDVQLKDNVDKDRNVDVDGDTNIHIQSTTNGDVNVDDNNHGSNGEKETDFTQQIKVPPLLCPTPAKPPLRKKKRNRNRRVSRKEQKFGDEWNDGLQVFE